MKQRSAPWIWEMGGSGFTECGMVQVSVTIMIMFAHLVGTSLPLLSVTAG